MIFKNLSRSNVMSSVIYPNISMFRFPEGYSQANIKKKLKYNQTVLKQ